MTAPEPKSSSDVAPSATSHAFSGAGGALGALPALLRDEPGLTRALGDPTARLAVVEVARPIAIAALATLSSRRPLVVSCPTGTMAGQLADDLAQFLPPGEVVHFPGWETLPFERVSPSVETMGQRLDLLWRLRDPERCPGRDRRRRPGAPAEARTRRHHDRADHRATGSARWRAGRPRRAGASPGRVRLPARGTRRAPRRVRPPRRDRRRLPLDRRRPDPHRPVGRRGRPADPVRRQRPTLAPTTSTRSSIFPARELMPTDDVRARAARLVASEPWGREQWERLAEGVHFDGMESWLPWLVDDDLLLTDVLPDTAKVAARRAAPDARPGDSTCIAEEDDLARTLASTWARDPDKSFPRLHADPDTLLDSRLDPQRSSRRDRVVLVDRLHPGVARHAARRGLGLGSGRRRRQRPHRSSDRADRTRLPGGRRRRRHRVGAAPPRPPARQRPRLPGRASRATSLRAGGSVVVAPLHRGCTLPNAKVAIVAESDLTGRRRAHRTIRDQQAPESASTFEDLKAGNYVVHHQHGVGQYEGMVKRAIGGVERDYLLISYKGGDKLYVPSRPDRHAAPVRRRRGTEAAPPRRVRLRQDEEPGALRRPRDRAGARGALPEAGATPRATAFAQDTPWQAEMEEAFPYVETPDQRTAIDDIKRDMELAHPMDRLVCGDVGFGKTEVAIRAAFKAIQDGKQVAVLAPTTLLATQHGNTFADRFAGFPIRVEVLSPVPHRRPGASKVIDGRQDAARSTASSAPTACSANDVKFKDLGLLIVDEEQRFGVQHKETMKKMKTNVDVLTLSATPIPRTLEMSPRRHPRPVAAADAAGRPPADPHLRRRVRRARRRRGDPPRAAARGPGVLGAQPGAVDRHRASRLRELVPEARIAIAHGQMDEGTLERRAGLLGRPVRRARVHHHHRVGHRHADGQHARRRALRPARPRPDAPAAWSGRTHRVTGLRLPLPPARQGAHRGGVRAAADDRRVDRTRRRASRSRCATSRSAAPATCSASRSPATSPPSATTCTARW